ncbi:MAG: OmpA family protein [Bacteroidales bacterium]
MACLNVLFKKNCVASVIVVASIFLLMLGSVSYGQGKLSRDGILEVNGWLLNDNEDPIKKANVKILQDNIVVEEVKTNRRGKFIVELPIDNEYVAEFSSEGYASKKMSFNTKLPNEFDGFNVFYFEFIVELFPRSPGVDYSLLEVPVVEVAYLDDKEQFFFEETKARPMLAKVEELKIHSYEMLELRKDYDLLIETADNLLKQKEYEDAIAKYNNALDYFPDEEYPRQKVNEILAVYEPEDDDSMRHIETLAMDDDTEQKSDDEIVANDEVLANNNVADNDNVLANNDVIIAEDVVEQSLIKDAETVEYDSTEYVADLNANESEQIAAHTEDNEAVITAQTFSKEEKESEEASNLVIEEESYDIEISGSLSAYFDFASYYLTDATKKILNNAVAHLNKNPESKLVINGHSDKRGDPLFNFYLSQLRAQTAYEYCVENGIEPGRIITLAYGQNRPIIKDAKKEKEHKQNRRVELEFVDNAKYNNLLANIQNETLIYLNDLESERDFAGGVEYMVQFILSVKPVGTSFFHRILNEYPEANIVYYFDKERMHRYSIGSYNSIEDVTAAAIKLQSIGYDVYVVAFSDGERIPVKEARLMLGEVR